MTDPVSSILVLAQKLDRWFAHPEALAELLRAEGINDVETAWLDGLTADKLAGRSLLILGPSEPAPHAREMILEFVRSGGGLISCAPGEAFASFLGLEAEKRGVMDGRFAPDQDGYPDHGLPVKGWSQLYTPGHSGLDVLLPLLGNDSSPLGNGAVFHGKVGNGTIVVLAYDPAACVYLIRQGNPLLSGCRTSGFDRMRPSDLFEEWQEDQDALWPVADLHCHYLRELVHFAWPESTVLPWLWYFPDGADTIVTFTSDDDWSTTEQFERLIESCVAHEAGLTFYLVQERSVMSRSWLEDLSASGFDFSIHPDLPPPTLPLWEDRLGSHVTQFEDTYGRSPSPSIRNHCITWAGYLEGVRIQARHGFTFDTNWFSLLPQSKHYMTGAGLPMRFADLSGKTLPMYQLATQFSDETTLGGQGFEWSLDLSPEQGVERITGLVDQNASSAHSMLCVNAHPVSFTTYSAALWEPVLEHSRANGVPVWDVDRFNQFWQRRRSVRLRPVPADAKPVVEGTGSDCKGLTAMVPAGPTQEDQDCRTINGRKHVPLPL